MMEFVSHKEMSSGYYGVYETPSGIRVVKKKHGYYPLTKDGQISRKHRYGGKVNDCEVWEHCGKSKRGSYKLTAIQEWL